MGAVRGILRSCGETDSTRIDGEVVIFRPNLATHSSYSVKKSPIHAADTAPFSVVRAFEAMAVQRMEECPHSCGQDAFRPRTGRFCSVDKMHLPFGQDAFALWARRICPVDRTHLPCGQLPQMSPFLFLMGALLLKMGSFSVYNGAIYRCCPWHEVSCSRGEPALDADGRQLAHRRRRKAG